MGILIVDDSPIDRMYEEEVLKEVGYKNILTAKSAGDAMEILEKQKEGHGDKVNLILMDIEMPMMTGLEACRQIKLTEDLKDIPIIMVTSRDDLSSFKLAFSAGALDYIQKPVKQGELLARVHAALKLKHEIDVRKAREKELIETNRLLNMEREKSEGLLSNILPEKIVRHLKNQGKVEPEYYQNVSVLFSDIVNFTELSSMMHPKLLISELNDIFTNFDDIMEEHYCERIKTIGDAYLAVCGMPDENPLHAAYIVKAALSMMDYLIWRNEVNQFRWHIRIGIHSGEVIGSIVGIRKYIYDIFGDAVNTASRCQSNSQTMRINISETTYHLVKDLFEFTERDPLPVKGKGDMKMYFVEGLKPPSKGTP
jgi:class 3 adenylate cyclase/CheY-like chemotaxis protein